MTTFFGPVTRHHCPLPECGWSYDVDLGAEPPAPIVVPVAAFDPVAFRVTDSRVLSEAISAASEKQLRELMEHAETAIREHLQGHDLTEVVLALVEAQSAVARVGELHQPVASNAPCIPDHGVLVWCPGCTEVCATCRDEDGDRVPYPCPTLAALDGGGEA